MAGSPRNQTPTEGSDGATVNVNIVGRVELDVPEAKAVKEERATHQSYRDAVKTNFFRQLRKVRFLVEVLTLVLLAIYTIINYWLYRTTRDTEQVTERAYVNVESITAVPIVVGQPLEAAVTYKNTGLTPARELYVAPIFDVIPRPPMGQRSVQWLKCQTYPPGTVLPPGISRSIDAATSTGRYAPRILTNPTSDALTHGQQKWVVGAMISYRDQFGHCHATFEPFWYNPASNLFDAAPVGFQQADD
jgi:hypothetical protein